jgi:hypothetical protein
MYAAIIYKGTTLSLSSRGADSDWQVGGIIMASAASLHIFLLAGDNPTRNSKTNNTGIKVGDRSLHPSGFGAYAVKHIR